MQTTEHFHMQLPLDGLGGGLLAWWRGRSWENLPKSTARNELSIMFEKVSLWQCHSTTKQFLRAHFWRVLSRNFQDWKKEKGQGREKGTGAGRNNPEHLQTILCTWRLMVWGPSHRSSTTVLELPSQNLKFPEGHHPRGTTLREALRGNLPLRGLCGVSPRALRGLCGVLRGFAGFSEVFRG